MWMCPPKRAAGTLKESRNILAVCDVFESRYDLRCRSSSRILGILR